MISVENMSIRSGEFALSDISLSVPTGSYGVLMGKTGCGKTTILESILGLRPIASGRILLDDQNVTQLNPALRGIGYVPQDRALFRGMTIRDHLAFALVIRKAKKKEINERVNQLATSLKIAHLLERTPLGLSGGEQQRVALGRALSFHPRVLCLDEPLSALDSETRKQMCELLEDISRQERVTVLHVTHNLEEARSLADCLFSLVDGKIQQLDTSREQN